MGNKLKLNCREDRPDWDGAPEIIAVSGREKNDLKEKLTNLKHRFSGISSWPEAGRIASETRGGFSAADPHRLLLLIETTDEPGEICESAIKFFDRHPESNRAEKHLFYSREPLPGGLAFIFPGQGSQYVSMGKDIVKSFPEAGNAILRADEIFNGAEPLSGFIYPETAQNKEEALKQEEQLRSTQIAQPAIGAVSLAILKVLSHFSIKPDAACGHSFGELTALHAAGRMDETAFLSLSVARGKYMAEAGGTGDKGSMLAVKAPLDKIDFLIRSTNRDLVLANRNSPDQGVVSGPTEAIRQMEDTCKKEKIRAILLPVSAAFHSRLVRDAAIPFQRAIGEVEFSAPGIPVYSNTTGLPYPADPEDAKRLLGDHLTSPVNFISEIENMHRDGIYTFLEVGPRTVLTGLVKSILRGRPFCAIGMDGSSGRRPGITDLAKALCFLASAGYPVNLKKWRQA